MAARIDRCTQCGGTWVRSRDFAELIEREEAGGATVARDALAAAPGQKLSPDVLFELVSCPSCRREMERVRFAQRASLVVDLCLGHGVWSDSGELVAVLEFVRQRKAGDITKGPAELADEAYWKRADEANAEMRREVSTHTSSIASTIQDASKATVDFDD